MAYVYKHTTLDTNQVFYIGIGSDSNYRRSKLKSDRNKLWERVVKKHGYKVDILFDNITWEEACQKEIELIAFYGRRDLNTGTLTNLTEGGEGILGFKHSEESIEKTINSEGYKNRSKSRDYIKGKTYEEVYGEKRAKEIKEKQSKASRPESRKGKDHHFFGKKRPDHSAKLKGRPNNKMKGLLVGDKNPMRNKEVALKVSLAKTGVPRPKIICPHCGKAGGSGNMERWHFDNCKSVKLNSF